jgi:hypothetical protein
MVELTIVVRRERAVLLDLTDRMGLRRIATDWTDRVDVVTGRCDEQVAPADTILIRPDGWATSPSGLNV